MFVKLGESWRRKGSYYKNNKGGKLDWISNYSTLVESGRRDSNPRHLPWQGSALPTELLPHYFIQRLKLNRRKSKKILESQYSLFYVSSTKRSTILYEG